jgi:hypothetical protein
MSSGLLMSTTCHSIWKNTTDIIKSYSSVERKFSTLQLRTLLIGGDTFRYVHLSETSDEFWTSDGVKAPT